jgi:hypothetical protein
VAQATFRSLAATPPMCRLSRRLVRYSATIDSVSDYREPTRQGPIIIIILVVFLAFAIGLAAYFFGVAHVAGS